MIALLCAVLSGAAFFLALSVEVCWPLAWIAPLPALWYALTRSKPMASFLCAFASYAIGGLYLVVAYAEVFPTVVLIIALAAPALAFASSVAAAELVSRRLGPWACAFAFPCLGTALDYLLSLGPDGAAVSLAYSQAGAPWLVQSSSLFGIWAVTFVLLFVAASLALATATRRAGFLAAALMVFSLNAGYGVWRIGTSATGAEIAIGLAVDDSLGGAAFEADADIAEDVVRQYDTLTRDLAIRGARVVVWPERVATLSDEWRPRSLDRLQSLADDTATTVIAGFDDRSGHRRNRAYVFTPRSGEPTTYDKRHLVQGLEATFSAGDSSVQFSPGLGVAICKDMDFPSTLRADSRSHELAFVFVPAWDFRRDGWWHARMAILRGVENGFSVARASREGLLTLTDAFGNQVARAESRPAGPVSIVGNVPAGPGPTLYTRLGDVFAWICLAAGLLLVLSASSRCKPGSPPTP